jgi:hypothetical protein
VAVQRFIKCPVEFALMKKRKIAVRSGADANAEKIKNRERTVFVRICMDSVKRREIILKTVYP